MTNKDNDLRFLLKVYNNKDDPTTWVHKVGLLISVLLNYAIVVTFPSHYILFSIKFVLDVNK